MIDLKIADIKKIALIVAAIVALISLNAAFRDYFGYRVNLLELKINQGKLTTLEHQRDSLAERLEAFNSDKQKLETMLFNENGLANFLQRMPQEASRSGVRVLKMDADTNFQKVKKAYSTGHFNADRKNIPEPVLMSLPIRTVIEGPLSSVEDFLIDLEQYKQLLSVKDVKITAKRYPVIEGEFTLTAFIIEDGNS